MNELLPEDAGVYMRLATSINDAGEILGVGSIDGNGNVGVVLVPAKRRIADIDQDCRVDFADLLIVLSQWGPCNGCPGDVNDDGFVDFADLLGVLGDWG